MTDADILKIRDAELALSRAYGDGLEKEIDDLRQQIHAYREYYDAQAALHALMDQNVDKANERARYRKANAELQTLRNKGN